MKTYRLLLMLCMALAFTPGCSVLSPKSPVTWEASRYLSFRDVYDVSYRAYVAHNVRVLDGKVSKADDEDVDKAWNTFRTAYLIALDQARGDENKFTPENVRKLANDVLDLIAAASL